MVPQPRAEILTWIARFTGLAAFGASLGQTVVLWISLAGSSSIAILILISSMVFGLLAADMIRRWFFSDAPNSRHQPESFISAMIPMAALSLAMIALSWTAPELMQVMNQTGSRLFAADSSTVSEQIFSSSSAALLLPGIVVVMMVIGACLWSEVCCPRLAVSSDRFNRWAMTAPGACLLLLHQYDSYPMALTVTITTLLALGLRCLCFGQAAAFNTAAPEFNTIASSASIKDVWMSRVAYALSGIVLVAICELSVRLFPGDVPLAILSLPLTMGWLMMARSQVMQRAFGAVMTPLALLMIAGFPVMFSSLVDLNLTLQTSQYSPWFVMLCRGLQLSILLAAAVIPAACLRHETKMNSLNDESSAAPLKSDWALNSDNLMFWIACGAIPAMFSLLLGLTPTLLMVLAVAGQCLRMTLQNISLQPFPGMLSVLRPRLANLPAVSMALMTIVLPSLILWKPIDTSRASQLLFSARAKAALERGVDAELIPQSDASRLLVRVETPDGEIHVWRRSGYLFEFRRNGRMIGRVSSDTRLSPQPAEDVLPAIVPMVMHPEPNRILLLGDDTGTCLRACSRLPVQRIVAVRSSEEVTALASEFTWKAEEIPPTQDQRVTIRHDIASAVIGAAPQTPFDVVIISGESPAAAGDLWEYTEDYYHQLRGQLTDEGVFCQRFRQTGLGAWPLQHAMATAMTAFPHVIAIQAAPGEILLIGSMKEQGLIGEHVLSRLQLDLIRREIASTGLDWTQIAVLPIVDAHDRIGIFSDSDPPEAISIANARFMMALPFEVLRPGDRAVEIQETFSPHQIRLAEAMPSGEAQLEMNRRISALNQQIEILAGMPDEPWTYRKSLRMEMQRNPRPSKDLIRDGKIVRMPHPISQLQQEYFITLGQCIRQVFEGDHRFEAFAPLERFTSSYEPLLSNFAYFEMVRLHEVAKHPAPVQEYRHRLHTVFFTESSDASVRPVIAALEQLTEHPELLSSDAERFDHLNSMIQKLIERWEARTAWEPKSAQRVENDVEQSVRAVNRALDRMADWTAAVDMSRDDFLRRRRFINAALITPLKQYREQVLAYRLRTEKPTEADSDTESPDDRPLVIAPENDLSSN